MLHVRTPCIGVCSTGIGDSVCRGCKRFAHEVIAWNSYNETERRAINARIDSLLTQLIQPRIEIYNPDKLRQQLYLQRIRHNPDHSPYGWFMDVLKAGASQIKNLDDFGCRLVPPFADLSMVELKRTLDEEFFVLSSVHYDLYFNRYT